MTESYLDKEINIFRPATPFMRDHLRVIWLSFAAWVIVIFGPPTATLFAPDLMSGTTVLGFPLHFALGALITPLGALLLSVGYALQRDRLDTKYGISHDVESAAPDERGTEDEDTETDSDTVAADGGAE
ncbi:solute symporter protein [Natrialba chahannaoensis JCM 10990]|uniref:Solute symporter protein n=2 Tax=Natrialba chahannaoensis TaxID=68911 RepID=M0AF06_9EURY|nr:solute symporter protein [Natrialba chahannaoensis JCM 10990]